MRKIVDFGRAKYAFVEIRRGQWVYVARERIWGKVIDWKNLTKKALSAKVEAQ